MDEELLKRAKALRKELNRRRGAKSNNLCCYGAIMSDGEDYIGVSEPCHADVGRESFMSAEVIVTLVELEKIREYRMKKGFTIPYYRWLLNKSPYADVFITKDAREAIEEGIICRTDVPSNVLCGALIATRYGWERDGGGPLHCYRWMQAWGELRKRGVDESLAFILCHTSYIPESRSTISWNGVGDHHACLSLSFMDEGGVKAFVKGNIMHAPNNLPPISEDPRFDYVHLTWQWHEGRKFFTLMRDGVEGLNSAIRGKPGLMRKLKVEFPFEDGLDAMAQWAKKYYLENLQ